MSDDLTVIGIAAMKLSAKQWGESRLYFAHQVVYPLAGYPDVAIRPEAEPRLYVV